MKTPAARIVGERSLSADAAGNGQVPSFVPFAEDFGYAPDLLVKTLADVDGDRDLDAVSFRMDIQHDREGDQAVISRGVFREPSDVAAGLLCTTRGAGDSQDLGAVGFGGSRVGRVACPDPLPPDLQIQPPDLPFDFPEIFPDVGDPRNPFIDIINPPDPLGPAPLLDFTDARSSLATWRPCCRPRIRRGHSSTQTPTTSCACSKPKRSDRVCRR